MTTQCIAFVTSNTRKFTTAVEHLSPAGIELEQVTLDLDEIQSDSVTSVALHKAQQAFRILHRPVIIEDSGFYIDELDGFPGPFVKYVIKSLGAGGVARLTDLTTTRHCHFEGVLVYIDAHGVPRTFTDTGDGGTVADRPTTDPQPGAWSALWDVFIPTGCTEPLSALREEERTRIFDGWAKQSVFTRFGQWLVRKNNQGIVSDREDRLLSTQLNFDFPAERIATRPRPKGKDLLLTLDRSTRK
ncbi:MAG: non-canonical purine NTP pyrophosphatase, partial [Pseudonocardiaceae bacterium]